MWCTGPAIPQAGVRLASVHTSVVPCTKLPRSCCFRAGPLLARHTRQSRPASAQRAAAGQPNGWLPLSGALWFLSEAAVRADQGADFSQGGFAKESYYVTLGLFLLSLPGPRPGQSPRSHCPRPCAWRMQHRPQALI